MELTKKELKILNKLNKPHVSHFNDLTAKYYQWDNAGGEKEYNKIIEYKSEKLIKPLLGQKRCGFLLPELSDDFYTLYMVNLLKETTLYNLSKGKEKQNGEVILKEIDKFSVNEVQNNSLDEKKYVLGRLYGEGTKTLRLIQKIQKAALPHRELKMFGSMKLDPFHKKRVALTIKPESFVGGGVTGDSCMSFDGEHQSDLFGYVSAGFVMMAHTKDFSWRAWVFFNPRERAFSIGPGYPRENYYAQFTVYNLFKERGFKPYYANRFSSALYRERGDLFVFAENPLDNYVYEDKYMDKCLYTGRYIRHSDFINMQAAICDGCDRIDIGERSYEDGVCPYCQWE